MWNQLSETVFTDETTVAGVTLTPTSTGVYTVSGTSLSGGNFYFGSVSVKEGHIYLLGYASITSTAAGNGRLMFYDNTNKITIAAINPNNASANTIIATATSTGTGTVYFNFSASDLTFSGTLAPRLFDLTQMFGSDTNICTALGVTNLDTTANQNTAIVNFKAMFPKSYYEYDAGSMLNVNIDGLKTVGFNAYDHDTQTARVKGGMKYEIVGTYGTLTLKDSPSDASGDAVTVETYTTGQDGQPLDSYTGFTPERDGYVVVTGGSDTTCIHLVWSGYRNGETETYNEHNIEIPISEIKDSQGNQVFPYGLLSAGSVHDELTSTGCIKRVGVTFGNEFTLHNTSTAGYNTYKKTLSDGGYGDAQTFNYTNIFSICYNGTLSSASISYETIQYNGSSDKTFYVAISPNRNITDFILYYELATPITINFADVPQTFGTSINLTYSMDDFGTEEFTSSATTDPQTNLVPATSFYMINLRDSLRSILNGNGGTVMYDQVQSLTETEKGTARDNIGAATYDGTYPDMTVGVAGNLTGRGTVPAEYTFRTSGGDADLGTGVAKIDTVKGNTIVWNQICPTVEITDATGSTMGPQFAQAIPVNHKIYVSFEVKKSSDFVATTQLMCVDLAQGGNTFGGRVYYNTTPSDGVYHRVASIVTNLNSSNNSYYFRSGSPSSGSVSFRNVAAIDLTLMFGSGNEPTTVAEFESLYPLSYYPYNAGTLINNTASGIKTIGFNQWDEEWELGGYSNTTGEKVTNGGMYRSKNFIPIFPNTTYYWCQPNATWARRCYYDADKNFISYVAPHVNTAFTTPNNAYFMTLHQDGTTYNNDICINLSWSGYRNGEYEPYEEHYMYFNGEDGSLRTITGKLNGEGESVVIFPDGLRSAGTVYDEVKGNTAIKRVGVVDLGTLTWNATDTESQFWSVISKKTYIYNINEPLLTTKYTVASSYGTVAYWNGVDKTIRGRNNGTYVVIHDSSYTDAATFQTAMSGVMLYYELATPETYTLDTAITSQYYVNDFGTEERLPQDTSSELSAPILYDVQYAMNATDTIRRLPVNYISKDSFTNFCSSLSSALGGALDSTVTITPAYDSNSAAYTYTITITPNS